MALVRWSPIRNAFTVNSEIDRLFDNFLSERMGSSDALSDGIPAIDVEETEQEFLVTAELPGMQKKDIKISFENNYLTLSGEKKESKVSKESNFYRKERSYGRFSRSIPVPSGVMLDKIEAEYEQGVLKVKIPKTEEAKPKQIEIKVK
jgi:HSP20 family protein